MAALLWGLGLVFLLLGGTSFYIWFGVFALVGFVCAIFNVSTKYAEGGVLCVYVCGIRIFKVDAAQVRSIRLVNNAATSWSTRWLFGLYIAGRRKWWAAAGVPVVEIDAGEKAILVTLGEHEELARVVAEGTGRRVDEIAGEMSILGI